MRSDLVDFITADLFGVAARAVVTGATFERKRTNDVEGRTSIELLGADRERVQANAFATRLEYARLDFSSLSVDLSIALSEQPGLWGLLFVRLPTCLDEPKSKRELERACIAATAEIRDFARVARRQMRAAQGPWTPTDLRESIQAGRVALGRGAMAFAAGAFAVSRVKDLAALRRAIRYGSGVLEETEAALRLLLEAKGVKP